MIRKIIEWILSLFRPRPTFVVNVCESTSLLPNEFCPSIVTREYYQNPRPGEPVAPTETCAVHKKPEPTWPLKSARPLWVFIPELLWTDGDRRAFLKSIRNARAWGVRAFLLESWSSRVVYPWRQAIYNGTPVRLVIPEDGIDVAVKNLADANPDYDAALNLLLEELREFDLDLIASFEDECSVRNSRRDKRDYPLMGSIQTLSEDLYPELIPTDARDICEYNPDGLYGEPRRKHHQAWVARAVELTRGFPKIRYEIENEFTDLGWGVDSPVPKDWYRDMMAFAAAGGVPGADIFHSGRTDVLFPLCERTRADAGIYSWHGVVRDVPPSDARPDKYRILLSGDGGADGRSTTDVDVKGRHGISVEDARTLGRAIVARGFVGYEWMPRFAWRFNDNLANVDGIPTDVLSAFASAFE